ncbi:conserved hypothetical protein [Candidatus Magnetomoraceae bacterium gMMP-15]
MQDQITSVPVLEPETLRAIDLYLESIYTQSENAGNQMYQAGLKNTQIRGLETLVTSTTRFSEVINYIKNQTGKDKKRQWTQVAVLLLSQLKKIEKNAEDSYKITEISLDKLKMEFLPEDLIDKLKKLKKEPYSTKDLFLYNLEKNISSEILDDYKSLILKHAQMQIGTVLDIKIRLARGWVKQIVTHYLYKKTFEEKNL